MSIRPLDVQVAIPKLQDVVSIKQAELQKSQLAESNASNLLNKQIKENSEQVNKSTKSEKSDYRYDAKEKGNQTYQKPGEKKKKKEKDDTKKYQDVSGNRIDIKI